MRYRFFFIAPCALSSSSLYIVAQATLFLIPQRPQQLRLQAMPFVFLTYGSRIRPIPLGHPSMLSLMVCVCTMWRRVTSTGKTVLLLHGEPSWSYLYRKMIPILVSAGYHVYALDLVGFGKSNKLTKQSDYSISFHVRQAQGFINQLELTNIHYFIQDWGSIIGLRTISLMPDKFAKVVAVDHGTLQNNPNFTPNTLFVINTINGTNPKPYSSSSYTPRYNPMPSPLLVAYPNWNEWRVWVATVQPFYASVALQQMTLNDLPQGVLAAYDATSPAEDYIAGSRVFTFLAGIEPVLTIYGDKDNILGNSGILFRSLIPGCVGQRHVFITNSSHFIQEDNRPLIAQRLAQWFNQ